MVNDELVLDIRDIGAIFAHAARERRESAPQAGGIAMIIRPRQRFAARRKLRAGGCKKFASELAHRWRGNTQK